MNRRRIDAAAILLHGVAVVLVVVLFVAFLVPRWDEAGVWALVLGVALTVCVVVSAALVYAARDVASLPEHVIRDRGERRRTPVASLPATVDVTARRVNGGRRASAVK